MAVTWCGNTTGAEEEHELVYCVPAQVYSGRVFILSYEHRTNMKRGQNVVVVVVRSCLGCKWKISKRLSLFWLFKGAVGIGGNLASSGKVTDDL
jgi:hypothetical protein